MTDARNAGIERPGFRWRPWHFVLIGLLVVAVFVGLLLMTVLNLTRPVVDGSDAFMSALKDSNFEQAYALATPDLQREIGSAAKLPQAVGPFRPREWSWSQRRINNGIGYVEGSAEFADGQGRAEIELHKVGEEWRVAAFRFHPRR